MERELSQELVMKPSDSGRCFPKNEQLNSKEKVEVKSGSRTFKFVENVNILHNHFLNILYVSRKFN